MDLATLFQAITTASAVVASVALVFLANELRQTRLLLKKLIPLPGRPSSSHTLGILYSPAGFAIYVFRKNQWELESDLSAPGFEPSAPTIPGAFEGHVIKKESRPAGEP